MTYYLTLGCGIIVSFIFCIMRSKGANVKNLLFKSVSSLCYMLTAVFAVISSKSSSMIFGNLIIMGGALGLVGDILLDLKCIYRKDANDYLKSGFLFFLVGHIFYIGAIIWQNSFKWWHLLICAAVSVAIACFTVFTANTMKVHYGKYRKVVLAYVSFLIMTSVTSVFAAITTKETSMIVMAIGSICFTLSDVVLSFTYFGRNWDKPIHLFINHFLYYAGQYLIAASIIFIK